MKPNWLWLFILLVLTACSPLSSEVSVTDCPVDLPEGARGVTCGTISVPERHENPQGPHIELAYALLTARDLVKQPDPIVMVEGGPGGSAMETLLPVFATRDAEFFRAQRDLIIIEQRGTFHSEPALHCPQIDAAPLAGAPPDAHQACRDSLAEVDFNAYNSLQNAADIPYVVQALGHDEYNFFGLSYGTMLGQHLMRDHPEGLRSVILDSVVPLDVNFIPALPESADRAFSLLFDACAADEFCSSVYSDLESTFEQAVANLNEQPAEVTVSAEESFEVTVDGDFLVEFLFESLYDVELIPFLPGYITNAAAGDLVWVEEHGADILLEETFATGFFHTVLCAEDADFAQEVDSGVRPALAQMARETWDEFLAACEVWQVDSIQADEPVSSEVPTLLLAGEFDPITPPAFAEHAAESLPNGTAVTIPGGSHGALGAGECPFMLVLAFLDDPAQPIDTSCTEEMALSFQRPYADYVLAPVEVVGARVLVPGDWPQVDDGVFQPPIDDDLRMTIFTLEGTNADRAARAYIREQEPDGWEKFGADEVSGREWHIFLTAESGDLTVLSATAEAETIYVMTLSGPEARLGDLADVIYFPSLEAFELVE